MTQAQAGGTETVWTTRRLLAWVAEAFAKRGLESPKLSAEILLGHVLGCERLRLYMEPEREATKDELSRLRGLVGRALKDEPVQYLTGEAWFFGLPFAVDRRVLVPRPCTELVVETVLQRARSMADGRVGGEGVSVLDLCTGSGCIAISLAKNLKGARVVATDISSDAIAVARSNAGRHGVSIDLRQGDLFEALSSEEKGSFDFVVSNPPYIPDSEWADVPSNVKLHEPELALRGGVDGLALIRPLSAMVADWLKPGGTFMIETAATTARVVEKMVEETERFASGDVVKDLEGHERFVVATAVA